MKLMNQGKLVFWTTIAALCAILVVYYFSYLTGAATFYVFDLSAGWQPILTFIGDSYRRGRLPLWNPFVLNGIPEVAIPAPSIFYPPVLLFALMPFSQALAVELIFQQLVAGAGAYLLVRSFGWHRWSAVLAAIALPLCGMMFSLQLTPTLQGTIAWFVFAWWALRNIDHCQSAGKLLSTVLAAVAIYMMISAGVVEIFVPSLVFLSVCPLVKLRRCLRHLRRRQTWVTLLQLLAVVAGALMSAPIILPAIEWSRISPRALGLDVQNVFQWSCNWYDLVTLMAPQPLGDLYDPANAFRRLVESAPNFVPYIASEFFGPVALTLAIIGLADRRWRFRFWALGLIVLALSISLGSHVAPLVVLVKALHLTAFRYPVKAMAFASIVLIICAARGMECLLSGERASGIVLSAALWMLALIGGILLSVNVVPAGVSPLLGNALRIVGTALIASSILGLLITALCRQMTVDRKSATALAAVLTIGCAASLLYDAWRNQHPGPADFYTTPCPLAQEIQSRQPGQLPRVAMLYSQPYPPTDGRYARLDQQYQYGRQVVAPMRNVPEHIDSVLYFTLGQTIDSKIMWDAALKQQARRANGLPLASMCRIASAPLVAAQIWVGGEPGQPPLKYPDLDSKYFAEQLRSEPLNVALYRVKDPMPRVYFAAKVGWGKPHEAVRDSVSRSDQSGFEPRRMTILEHRTADEVSAKVSPTPDELSRSSTAIVIDRFDRVDIAATTPTANYLVFTDQYYAGWRAFIDDRETPIYPANVLFRAILVPAGAHHIKFVYQPLSLSNGFILAGFALIVLLVLAALSAALNVPAIKQPRTY